jgi:16S rRNA processing protein RimM
MDERDLISIGKFGRAHGIRGEIRLFPDGDGADYLEEGHQLYTKSFAGEETFTVRRVRWTGRFGILALEEVSDRDRAEELTNLEVFIDAAALPEVDEGEFYQRDLVGLPVFVARGDADDLQADEPAVGEVAGFFQTGANDVMVFKTSSDKEVFVPMIEDAIALIDLEDERILIHPFDVWAPADFSLE